jgi:hypothetical protein
MIMLCNIGDEEYLILYIDQQGGEDLDNLLKNDVSKYEQKL